MISFQLDATPIWGLVKSSSPMPTARSIPRAAAFSRPSVTSRDRGLMSGLSVMARAYDVRRAAPVGASRCGRLHGASAAAFSRASPFSKSLPISLSIETTLLNTVIISPSCWPDIRHVTSEPLLVGVMTNSTCWVLRIGFMNDSSISTRSGAEPVISIQPSPALRLPFQA